MTYETSEAKLGSRHVEVDRAITQIEQMTNEVFKEISLIEQKLEVVLSSERPEKNAQTAPTPYANSVQRGLSEIIERLRYLSSRIEL